MAESENKEKSRNMKGKSFTTFNEVYIFIYV